MRESGPPTSPAQPPAASGNEQAGGLPANHPLASGRTAESPLVLAARGHRADRLPVWFMRQAGRSLPEYRALRAGTAMLDACLNPQMAAEITLQPVRRHHVDAAIYFSDIVVPLRLAGVDVQIVAGVGPVLSQPVRSARDVAALPELDPDSLNPIREGVRLVVDELGSIPLIGFAGASFTVASYLVEGRPSRDYQHTRALMASDERTWHQLLSWVSRTTGAFLRAQGLAGASALQLFDSWAGALSLAEYQRYSAPHSAGALAAVGDLGLPRIHFGTRTRHLLVAMHEAGAAVMGVDAQTPLDQASALLGGGVPLQGNIDPDKLAGPWDELERHTLEVIDRGRAAPAHIVNLGHGVPPGTDPDVLTKLVELVHSQPAGGS